MRAYPPAGGLVDPPAGGLLSRWLNIMFIAYAIYNKIRDKIYIGHTGNLDDRIKRHNKELPSKIKSFTSKNSGTWILVYNKKFNTRKEAIKREKELKSFRGREFIRNLIKNK